MSPEARKYVDDIAVDGMLFGAAVRSRIRRGSVKAIGIPELPDGYVLVTTDDIPGAHEIVVGETKIPVLTVDDIRYRGQAVVLIAGPDERTVRAIADNVEIQYAREEPIRFQPPHEQLRVTAERDVIRGEPEVRFSEAFQVIEGEYLTVPVERLHMQPAGAVAETDGDGVRITTPSRWIYHVRESVAAVLGEDPERVTVRYPESGDTYDGYLWHPSLTACHAALLSNRCGLPVQVALTPGERRALTAMRRGVRIYSKTALDKDGDITAMDISISADTGAYPVFAQELVDRLCLASADTYACRHLRIRAAGYETSNPPNESYVSFGIGAAHFAQEVHATRLAELAQDDPSDWRLRNLVRPQNRSVTGTEIDGSPARRLIGTVTKRADFGRKYAAYEMLRKRRETVSPVETSLRGIGIGCVPVGGGLIGGEEVDSCTVAARMAADGKLSILTSAPLANSRAWDTIRSTAATTLGLGTDKVELVEPSTGEVPNSGPVFLSKNVVVIRRLVELCCSSLQKKRFRSPLPLEVRRSYRRPGKRQWSPDEFRGTPYQAVSWVAAVVEVELDPVTLEIGIREVWMDIAPGMLLDELAARTAAEVELGHAYDWCRALESRWEQASSYASRGAEAQRRGSPRVSVQFAPNESDRPGPIEGLATSAFVPAFISAVSQASGFYFDSIPLTAGTLHQYVER